MIVKAISMQSVCTMATVSVLDVEKGALLTGDAERVKPGLIGMVAIPSLSSNTLEPYAGSARVI